MGVEHPEVVVICDRFPELTETFIAGETSALRRLGMRVRVEAADRPRSRGVGSAEIYWCDEGTGRRAMAMLRLVLRHPVRCMADLRHRRRWRASEAVPPLRWLAPAAVRTMGRRVHLHAHFATGPGLSAMRIARVTGATYSVAAHGYDIYQRPANLAEKIRKAAFATSGCRYAASHLEGVAGPEADVHVIVMGVDGERFRRTRPYPGGRRILAVGRLVEKKGFVHLIEAVAQLRATGFRCDAVRIVGDGPLRGSLEQTAATLGVADLVDFAGALPHHAVREEIQRADVLCMPCVVAADGDRDTMPVVVKEALAMEVPVVGTAEVGLPEVIRPAWGRLVPPRDARALAEALRTLLLLPAEERREMGAAGRRHVLKACDIEREAGKLRDLIVAAGVTRAGGRGARRGARSSPRWIAW